MRVFLLASLLLLLAACSRPGPSTAKAPEPSQPEPAQPKPAQPEPSRPEPLPSGEPLGTAHPLGYLHSPPGAHWLAVSQVREDRNGDGRADGSPYLLFGPGPGERIDAFCASDPIGRYLVVVRGDSTWLIDSYTRAETRLGPRPNPLDPVFIGGGSLFFPPPCAQFSADGRRLLFVRPRPGDGRLMLVVREVQGGSESILNPGPGLLDTAQLDPTGQWVFYEAVERDTNGDGTLSRINRHDFGGSAVPEGDAPESRVQRVDGRALREPDSLLVPLGQSILRRGSRGELLVEDASGQRTEWVPAECGAYLLHVDPVRELLLVACRNRGSPSPVELHGRAVHQALGVTTYAGQFLEERFSSSTRLVTIAPVSPPVVNRLEPEFSDTLLDLERRTVHPMHGQVLHTHGTRALVLDARQQVWLVDVERGERTALGKGGGESLWFQSTPGVVLVEGLLVDLEAGRLLGRPAPGVLAVDARGRVLRHDVTPVSGSGLGPIRWHLAPPHK
ncbi:hypothetical protein ACN28I_34105 [Archangium gephyra]|uniref:hypothetical protein n=1 Tax=Archangium gephyra TaxID=48 RepID=UPI003B78299C